MDVISLIVGIASGGAIVGVVVWLVNDRTHRSAQASQATELALLRQREQDLQQLTAASRQTIVDAQRDASVLQQHATSLEAKLAASSQKVTEQSTHFAEVRDAHTQLSTRYESVRQQIEALNQRHTQTLEQLASEKRMLIEQRQQLETDRVKMRESFAELSQQALVQNSKTFIETAEQRFKLLQTEAAGSLEQKKLEMSNLLQPMGQLLDQYKTKLDDIEKSRGEAYLDIKSHLTQVATTQENLSKETTQLVSALRKPQGRGRWGELTLKRLFELAGMAERVTFEEQVSTDDGRLRPDCIVHLPNDRQVIVDSKCVMDAFLDATACEDETLRRAHLVRHAQQIRSRVAELSSKAYWERFEKAADYVVMFLPGEAFYHAAVEVDPTLIEDALNQRVIVTTPTTLLGLLRVIEHGWRQNLIEQSAKDIRDVAGQLYERINKVADTFAKLGKAINGVNERYNEVVGSLEKRVLPTARRLNEMGIGASDDPIKELDEVQEHVRDLSSKAWKVLPDPDEAQTPTPQ